MAYILGKQVMADDPRSARHRYKLYQRYLKRNERKFPPRAYELATSNWFYGFSDHRAPHDAKLTWSKFEESETALSLRVRMLGAYHDLEIELFYPIVYSYTMHHPLTRAGHRDWLYSELRVNKLGRLLHEIELCAGPYHDEGRWLIEASDVEFSSFPRAA